jgi:Tfp pilus assembly PilM family ATPase
MGLLDNFRGLGRGAVGLELGRTVAAAQVKGDGDKVVAAGQSGHAGLSGEELGKWLRQWLDTIGCKAKSAHTVLVDDDAYHYLVTLPEMSDSERHLAAGAEVRKLAPVPAGQLAYSHLAVGAVQEGGAAKQRVMIAAVERGAVRKATEAAEAAGLSANVVTTVPVALVKANELLPPVSGGTAIAYLAAGRSYLVVFQDGVVELVRDFVLRSDDRDFDPQTMTDLVISELRRSFLYFGQRAQGATVDRLVLAGPMANMSDVAARLRESLGISVELFDASSDIDLGPTDPFDQPALAVAMGAASMRGNAAGNLVAPEEYTEKRARRVMSTGVWVAAAAIVAVLGFGLLAFLNNTVESGRLQEIESRIAARQPEMAAAQARETERAAHAARGRLLQQRALESTLVGATFQRISQRVPDQLTLETVVATPVTGPGGALYWDIEMTGLVLGASRSESQSIFNRFYALVESDPLVHSAHLMGSLQVGSPDARSTPGSEVTARQAPQAERQNAEISTSRWETPGEERRWNYVSRNPWLANRPLWYLDGPAGQRPVGAVRGDMAPTLTTLDELPPFGPDANTVGFTVLLQLKAVTPGANR